MFLPEAPWTIVGSDTTTLTLPNTTLGLRLIDVSGFDAPRVRALIEDMPADHGARPSLGWYGSRPVTLEGLFTKPAQIGAARATLHRAFRGLAGACTLKTAAYGGLPALQIAAWLQDGPRYKRASLPGWLVSLDCPDPRMYAQTLTATPVITASGATTCTGTWTNNGDFDTPPVVTVAGPVALTASYWYLNCGAFSVKFNTALTVGQSVVVDMAARTATGPASANWYPKVVYPGTTWWSLAPGANTVSLTGAGMTTGGTASITPSFRDAFA